MQEINFQSEIHSSVQYLSSEAAVESIAADPYWPKWNSPWWHMLLLHEMGETQQIPEVTIRAYVTALNKIPLKIFPIHPGELPAGVDPFRGCPCHCQLGNVYQVLAAWGIDVDRELPWIRPWFLRYQMADGGLNCDSEAYLVQEECPSSMVGTISAFEAILMFTPRPWTTEEKVFLNKGAEFLIARKLMLGSPSKHNSEERIQAQEWLKPCFPRFYFYDVLRGLNALLLWAEKMQQTLPDHATSEVMAYLARRFPDGRIRNERHSYAGVRTLSRDASGEWQLRQPATSFTLLARVSKIGEISPFLTEQWAQARPK